MCWSGLLPAAIAILLAQGLAAQVSVSVRMSKPEYLVGEPIVLLIDVTNVGTDTVAYGNGCDFDVTMSVAGVKPKSWLHKDGCFTGHSEGGSCGGIDHPPGLTAGKSLTFKRLLVGYQLGPGSYVLKAAGKASLRWWLYAATDPKHYSNSVVEGDHFDSELEFQVRPGNEEELKHAFAPWMEQAETGESPDNAVVELSLIHLGTKEFAKKAIAEAAPPFLEEFVRKFTKQDPAFTITALRNMDTSSSRRALVQLFEESDDAELRADVMSALRDIANSEQVDFFAGLLATQDADIRKKAIFALGRIGGWRAVQEIAQIQSEDKAMNETINEALAVTRSADAVPVLIERYRRQTTRDGVCEALATLTHLAWCAPDHNDQVSDWQRFWEEHQTRLNIYGDDDCDGAFFPKPLR